MKVWIAIVSHRHGTNAYAARSEAGLNRQLADYVRHCWDEVSDYDEVSLSPPEDDVEAIAMYFGAHHEEQYEFNDCELENEEEAACI